MAHALPRSCSSPGMPSDFSVVPVAITTARADTSLTGGHAPMLAISMQTGRFGSSEYGAGGGSLLLNDRTEVIAWNTIWKSRIPVDAFDAYQLAAEYRPGQDVRFPPGTCRRQRRGQTRHTTTDNHEIVDPTSRLILVLCSWCLVLGPCFGRPGTWVTN